MASKLSFLIDLNNCWNIEIRLRDSLDSLSVKLYFGDNQLVAYHTIRINHGYGIRKLDFRSGFF